MIYDIIKESEFNMQDGLDFFCIIVIISLNECDYVIYRDVYKSKVFLLVFKHISHVEITYGTQMKKKLQEKRI